MKRLILTLATAGAAALAIAGPAFADDSHHHRDGGGDRHSDGGGRGGERRSDGGDRHHDGRWDGDRGRGSSGDGRWDGDRGRGGEHGERWDQSRNNGYYYNNRWFNGPPPASYYGLPGFRLGFSGRRGGYLPPFYRSWALDDYYSYHLRRPPFGYHWVRIDNEFLLVSDSTGLIFDVIEDGGRGY